MVGEIRDEETAGIAVNAALTGHLLLSTLHTNDAATTLPRLLDMKIEPFLIASTVNIAIGQRLVRKICSDCKTEKRLSLSEIGSLLSVISPRIAGILKNKHQVFYYGKGCKTCADTGYLGRIGVYEVLEITDKVKQGIMGQLNASEIERIAISEGMTTMLEDGFNKALNGITSIEEVLRVMHE
jgi:type II secretory ATPase GspE/PulE/Tfp pilus assembly ATPase PilB-like protein